MLQKTLVIWLSWIISSGAWGPLAPEAAVGISPWCYPSPELQPLDWVESASSERAASISEPCALIPRMDAKWKSWPRLRTEQTTVESTQFRDSSSFYFI